ncbi:hypothetical protein [Fibrobacter sp.]|uniref:hypothetical protein n=1 Tax=Fibrobacter sp. TaxID=35828 RepID=UPI0025C1DDC7|nr:hypothetical protein [Fibrobacter sp.]MBS7273336.1 hypothetical protein [Fibrobacter sp.]MDD7498399.1 hypothetical protein [Fibrobacter sp.]MDY5725502.1 hypothetical protein [Fibrobacter sp.]
MNYRFKKYINSASANKLAFDSSIEGIRSSLHTSLNTVAPVAPISAKTGWLRGSLSYPWVLVCSLVPSLKELF